MLNEGGITLVSAIDTVQGMVSPGVAPACARRAPRSNPGGRCRMPSKRTA
jgi:hypothetical protein